jgi:hypothetical protein
MESKNQPRFPCCARCKKVKYCSRPCQTVHYKTGHKQECTQLKRDADEAAKLLETAASISAETSRQESGQVAIVVIQPSGSYPGNLPPSGMQMVKRASTLTLLPKALGIDLLLWDRNAKMSTNVGQNPNVALFMIDPSTGRTPEKWLSVSDERSLVRSDGRDYTPEDHEILRQYLCDLQQMWSAGGEPSTEELSPKGFQHYVRGYLNSKYLHKSYRAPVDKLTTVLAPRVQLHGLQSKPSLNGQEGFRGRWREDSERYEVYLDSLPEPISVKSVNLKVLPEDHMLTGMVIGH